MHRSARILTIISALAVLACLLAIMDFPSGSDISEIYNSGSAGLGVKLLAIAANVIGPLVLSLLTFSPFALIYFMIGKLGAVKSAILVLIIAVLTCFAAYLYIFWNVFWFNKNPDAQDGIVLVIMPFILLTFAGSFCAAAFGVKAFTERRRNQI